MTTGSSARTTNPTSQTVFLDCEEHAPIQVAIKDLLDTDGILRLHPEVENGDYFALTLGKGRLTLRARGFVGFIPLNNRVMVRVRPRVPIQRLSRMVRISGEPPTVLTSIREYATGEVWDDTIVNLYAAALVQHTEVIVQQGLLQEYERHEDMSSFPHGRLLLHESARRLGPMNINHAAFATWFERTPDIPANRCLKYAVVTISRELADRSSNSTTSRQLHRRLNALAPIFEGVRLDHDRRFLEDPVVTGSGPLPSLRDYYRDALNVALAVIARKSVLIDSVAGEIRLPSLVLNMNSVFERYVRETLRLYAVEHRWPGQVLDGNGAGKKLLFDKNPSPYATPDINITGPGGRTALLIEVKNVPSGYLSSRESINQAITYAVSYNCPRVVLVHPRSAPHSPHGLHLMGRSGSVEIFQYQIDLGNAELVDEDTNFAEAMASLLPSDVTTPA